MPAHLHCHGSHYVSWSRASSCLGSRRSCWARLMLLAGFAWVMTACCAGVFGSSRVEAAAFRAYVGQRKPQSKSPSARAAGHPWDEVRQQQRVLDGRGRLQGRGRPAGGHLPDRRHRLRAPAPDLDPAGAQRAQPLPHVLCGGIAAPPSLTHAPCFYTSPLPDPVRPASRLHACLYGMLILCGVHAAPGPGAHPHISVDIQMLIVYQV